MENLRFTRRGYAVIVVGFVLLMGIVGHIETAGLW
jgi:hypothetical protein